MKTCWFQKGDLVGALVGLALIVAASTSHGTEFVAGSEDIPLMPGLTVIEDAGMVFDSPAGRIVEGVYQGTGDEAAIRAFYGETLPSLGWQSDGPDRFHRDGEQLELDFFGSGTDLTIRFTLAPM